MDWLSDHRYAILFSLAAVVLLVITGASSQTSVAPNVERVVNISAGTISPVAPGVQAQMPPDASTPSPAFAPVAASTSSPARSESHVAPSASAPPTAPATAAPALQEAAPTSSASTSESESLLSFVYSLIPSSTPLGSPPQAQSRTMDQQALYDYGNEAGLVFLDFENAHVDMGQVLQSWINSRSDRLAQAAVAKIADDMNAAGVSLQSLPNVPPAATRGNAGLAASFEHAAADLKKVVAAGGSDSALADAMKTYDASADSFTKSFLVLVDLFTLHEITFGSSDPGSVFSFPSS